MKKQKIAHRFPTPHGWVVGQINSRKKNTGAWEGKYPGDGLFYQHKLEMEDYGIDKNWGFVKYLGDKWPDGPTGVESSVRGSGSGGSRGVGINRGDRGVGDNGGGGGEGAAGAGGDGDGGSAAGRAGAARGGTGTGDRGGATPGGAAEKVLVLVVRLEVAKVIKDNVVVSKRDLLHVLLEVVEGKREIQLML